MKKRTIGTIAGIALGIAGLAGLVAPTVVSEVKRARVETLDIYIEQPELSLVEQKIGEAVVRNFSRSDYFKSVSHPQSGRVQYNFPWDKKERVTNYVNGLELEKKLGRTSDAIIASIERKIGDNLWQFDNLYIRGSDVTKEILGKTMKKAPWLDGATRENPYTLQTFPDQDGKIRKVVYFLPNGETFTLRDTNGNGKADEIEPNF